jgi:hypothetical protein
MKLDTIVKPYELLKADERKPILEAVVEQCGLSPEDVVEDVVEDVYPTTALQEGLMALAVKQPGSYMARLVFELGQNVSTDRFKAAWEETLRRCEILRTRIIVFGDQTLQAVIRRPPGWADLASGSPEMQYGTPLCHYSLFGRGNVNMFSLTIHHSVYDGWTTGLIFQTLRHAYERTESLIRLTPFANFVSYALSVGLEQKQEYWRAQLDEASRAVFPRRAAAILPTGSASTTRTLTRLVPFEMPASASITKATVLRAAWAIVLARYNDTKDITFGASVAGRQAPIAGIEHIAGPAISTLPVRVKMDGSHRAKDFLHDLQAQAMDMMPFEQMGLQNIAKLGPTQGRLATAPRCWWCSRTPSWVALGPPS